MHSARLAHSDRLQRVLRVLSDGRPHSTLDLMQRARVCAVNSCVAELRDNGVEINCTRKGDVWRYKANTEDDRCDAN